MSLSIPTIALNEPQQTEPGQLATADTYWRSLYFFNGYRFVVALLLLAAALIFGESLTFGSQDFRLFIYSGGGYVLFSAGCFVLISMRRHFHLQLGIQVGADILFIVLMMFASGGIPSGLGLLLLSALAAAGLISRGRLTLFYAALASIAVLTEQTVQVLYFSQPITQYVQAGLLSIAYFATAGVAHTLARYLVATERLAAQREIDLANMAEVNQLVLDDMQDGVLVVDQQGVIRQHNAQAEFMLGPLHRQRRQPLLKDYAPQLAEQFAQWRGNPVAALGASTFVPLNEKVSARFMGVGRNRNVGAVIFLQDLTQVQAQARQMKLASLGRLTANIAHEIRNPLSAISHATELLQEESVSSGTVGRLLTIVGDNVTRLNRVVTDVLRLNRGERAHTEQFLLTDFLTTFIEQFIQNEKIEAGIIDFRPAVSPQVLFDRSHLNQVMWNLCRNAVRHCRGETASIRIFVNVIGEGSVVKLDVVDDGPGVSAVRSQLFEPFFTTVASGTGLGLYIAREICEANGATLECVDVSEGAQFTILCQGA